jgi:His/Glu/Gln/Arg/opine family amino acid ABC transporter permease subunit
MAAFTESFTKIRSSVENRFHWQYFLQDNVTGSPLLAVWVLVLALGTAFYTVRQLNVAPLSTIIILIAIGIGLVLAVANGLFQYHTKVGHWLKFNLLSSVSNVLLTLLLSLWLASAARGIWQYAVVDATFSPAETAPAVRQELGVTGASWGVLAPSSDIEGEIGGARNLLYYGRLEPQNHPRVQVAVYLLLVLSVITFALNRTGLWARNNLLRRIFTYIWLASPLMLFVLLNGVPYEAGSDFISFSTLLTGAVVFLGLYGLLFWQRVIKFSVVGLVGTAVAWPVAYVLWRLLGRSYDFLVPIIGRSELFPPINPDSWGGLLLTLIVATSVIILSFPIGIFLALGRRSQVRGIPGWVTWPIAIVVTILGFRTTPQLLEDARNSVETVIAFWPLLIIGIAYALQRGFKGNIVAAASTTFIEVVRGVPLITLLFMGIIMGPFFFKSGTTVSNTYSVIAGYTIFASAYMAELIRGGLQAIPKGQFEAADALGLNTLQKMRFVVLPQALRILIPALVGSFIGNFKSSSLVSVVGLFDLVGIATAIIGNPQWLGLKKELYYAMAIFYFLVSFAMSSYSRRLEARLGVGER